MKPTTSLTAADFLSAIHNAPNAWQAAVASDQRSRLGLAPRSAGATNLAAALALETACAGKVSLCVGFTGVSAVDLTNVAVSMASRLGVLQGCSATRVGTDTGGAAIFLPAIPAVLRGYTAQRLIVDSARDVNEECFETLKPMALFAEFIALSSAPDLCDRRPFFLQAAKDGMEPGPSLDAEAERLARESDHWFVRLWRSRTYSRHLGSADDLQFSPAFLAEQLRCLGARAYRRDFLCLFGGIEDPRTGAWVPPVAELAP